MVVGFWTQTFTDCTWRGPEDPLSVSILLSSSPEINPYSNLPCWLTNEGVLLRMLPICRAQTGDGSIDVCMAFHSAYLVHIISIILRHTREKKPRYMLPYAKQHLQGNFCHAEDNATPHRARKATLSTATWNRQNATVGKVAWLQPPGTGLVHAINMMQTLLRSLMSISI